MQAGVAYTEERRIVLNAKLLEAGREADRDATFLHECAHILANRRYRARCNHDHRWKRVMEMLGEPPPRLAPARLPLARGPCGGRLGLPQLPARPITS